MPIKLGDRVELLSHARKQGVVRFLGETSFASGVWVGVELDSASGKNDGSVQGKSYFSCQDKHGIFVKESQVKKVRVSRLAKPVVSATPAAPNAAVAPASPPATSQDSAASRSTAAIKRKAELSAKLERTRPSPRKNTATVQSTTQSSKLLTELETTKKALAASEEKLKAAIAGQKRAEEAAVAATKASATTTRSTLSSKGVAQLEAQVAAAEEAKTEAERIAEEARATWLTTEAEREAAIKRAANGEARVAELEEALSVRDASHAKLASELRATKLAAEQAALASAAKDSAARSQDARKLKELTSTVAELQEMAEILTLDKEQLAVENELAEEKCEELTLDLETAKMEAEQAEAELEEYKSSAAVGAVDGCESGGALPAPQAVLTQNSKLREALKRLHESATSEKVELSAKLRESEKAAATAASLESENDKLKAEKQKLTEEVAELKEMLDTAQAFESMVEELSEKNMDLGDRVSELEATNTDLEELRELSEQVEEDQAAYQATLRVDLEKKDAETHRLVKTLSDLRADGEDKQRVIKRFRAEKAELASVVDALREQLSEATAESVTLQDNSLSKLDAAHTLARQTQQRELQQTRHTLELSLCELERDTAKENAAWVSALVPTGLMQPQMQDAKRVLFALCAVQCKAGLVLNALGADSQWGHPRPLRPGPSWRGRALCYVSTALSSIRSNSLLLGQLVLCSSNTSREDFARIAARCLPPTAQLEPALDSLLASLRMHGHANALLGTEDDVEQLGRCFRAHQEQMESDTCPSVESGGPLGPLFSGSNSLFAAVNELEPLESSTGCELTCLQWHRALYMAHLLVIHLTHAAISAHDILDAVGVGDEEGEGPKSRESTNSDSGENNDVGEEGEEVGVQQIRAAVNAMCDAQSHFAANARRVLKNLEESVDGMAWTFSKDDCVEPTENQMKAPNIVECVSAAHRGASKCAYGTELLFASYQNSSDVGMAYFAQFQEHIEEQTELAKSMRHAFVPAVDWSRTFDSAGSNDTGTSARSLFTMERVVDKCAPWQREAVKVKEQLGKADELEAQLSAVKSALRRRVLEVHEKERAAEVAAVRQSTIESQLSEAKRQAEEAKELKRKAERLEAQATLRDSNYIAKAHRAEYDEAMEVVQCDMDKYESQLKATQTQLEAAYALLSLPRLNNRFARGGSNLLNTISSSPSILHQGVGAAIAFALRGARRENAQLRGSSLASRVSALPPLLPSKFSQRPSAFAGGAMFSRLAKDGSTSASRRAAASAKIDATRHLVALVKEAAELEGSTRIVDLCSPELPPKQQLQAQRMLEARLRKRINDVSHLVSVAAR